VLTFESLQAALGRPLTSATGPGDSILGVVGTSRCRLGDFPEGMSFAAGEGFACQLAPLRGGLSGVGVLALGADGLARLVAPARGGDAVDAYAAIGRQVFEELVGRLAPWVGETRCEALALRQGSLVAAVLSAHAPLDAGVLGVDLRLGGARAVPALAYLIVDSKLLSG
jgi:hypothetical protein